MGYIKKALRVVAWPFRNAQMFTLKSSQTENCITFSVILCMKSSNRSVYRDQSSHHFFVIAKCNLNYFFTSILHLKWAM